MAGEILVPIGGTAESIVALPTALSIAQALDAAVHVAYVVQVPSGPLAGTAAAFGAGPATAAVRARIDRTLATVAAEITAAGLQGTSSVLEGGDVSEALLEQVRQRSSRLVVMAARPRTAIERALLGSVADRLVREPDVPVVVVPVRNQPEHRELVQATEIGSGLVGAALRVARPLSRILLPIDESPHALRAISALGPAARAADDLILFHVVVPERLTGIPLPPPADGERSLQNHMREACDRLDGIADQLRAVVPVLRKVVIRADHPAPAIVGAARDRGADLIAMSTRGDGGLKRVAVGSTASEVLRTAEVPVLLVARR